jgi:predicted N-acetyltransferase YhbS
MIMVVVEAYSPKRLDAAVEALASAFVTNPLHLSAFGPDRLDRNRFFFRVGLRRMFTGSAFVALDGGAIVGYVHFNTSPLCLPPPEALPAFAAAELRPLEDAAPRVIEWFARWARLDPAEPHSHLGPIGVVPAYQGQGVGRTLMSRYVEHLDGEKIEGYLETDRAGNVDFYKKFGFVVVREEKVIGVPTWYMRRPPP